MLFHQGRAFTRSLNYFYLFCNESGNSPLPQNQIKL